MKTVRLCIFQYNCYYCLFNTVPESTPLNLKISFINSTTLLLSWLQPLIPNGIIIKYTINCIGENNKNHSVVTSTTMTLVSDLSSYTNYTCSVFGHTRIGIGPPITGIGLTDEDSECSKTCSMLIKSLIYYLVPEQVQNVTVTVINSSTVYVHWSSPLIPNGAIIYYELKIYIVESLTNTLIYNTSLTDSDHVPNITLGL